MKVVSESDLSVEVGWETKGVIKGSLKLKKLKKNLKSGKTAKRRLRQHRTTMA